MKLINQSFEILEQENPKPKVGEPERLYLSRVEDSIYYQIELAGRTCYKSIDKIVRGKSVDFARRMINSKHFSMLEHGTVYLIYPEIEGGNALKYTNNPYSKISFSDKNYYITTNMRVLVENDWLLDLKYLSTPTKFHYKRISVKFICNRQVSHEFVRHRVFSFAQESTRYCNYTKDKFENELTFIKPCWCTNLNIQEERLIGTLQKIEDSYINLIKEGWQPQQVATILPNAIKTELIMTGFIEDWKHFFDLRALGTTGAPHPQAKELAEPLMNEFIKRGYLNETREEGLN